MSAQFRRERRIECGHATPLRAAPTSSAAVLLQFSRDGREQTRRGKSSHLSGRHCRVSAVEPCKKKTRRLQVRTAIGRLVCFVSFFLRRPSAWNRPIDRQSRERTDRTQVWVSTIIWVRWDQAARLATSISVTLAGVRADAPRCRAVAACPSATPGSPPGPGGSEPRRSPSLCHRVACDSAGLRGARQWRPMWAAPGSSRP